MRRIEVAVRRFPDALALGFRLYGNLTRVRLPEPRAPRTATRLWEHTCFEAFVAIEEAGAYHEFNFAPSGEWAAYAFRSYRDRVPLNDKALAPEVLAPAIMVRAAGHRLALDARVRLDRLSPQHTRAPLRLGLSAVIEALDGTLSYWALRHSAGKPDFHRDESRALLLEPPVGE